MDYFVVRLIYLLGWLFRSIEVVGVLLGHFGVNRYRYYTFHILYYALNFLFFYYLAGKLVASFLPEFRA